MSVGGHSWLPAKSLLAGLVVIPVWTFEAQQWGHVDDVTALLAAMVAVVLVSSGRQEIIAGLILGTGAAAKPWAVILLPMLFAYARPQVARAGLAFVVGALAWWAPFVIAAPGTVHALGSVSLTMINHPTWHLVGITGSAPLWIRPLQLVGGLVLSTVVVRRVGWFAVPAVALVWRVTTDPYDWSYYVMGPLIGAALWDLTRPAWSRLAALPWATLAAGLAEVWLPRVMPSTAPGVRLVWFLGLTTVVLLIGRRSTRPVVRCGGFTPISVRAGGHTSPATTPTAEPALP